MKKQESEDRSQNTDVSRHEKPCAISDIRTTPALSLPSKGGSPPTPLLSEEGEGGGEKGCGF